MQSRMFAVGAILIALGGACYATYRAITAHPNAPGAESPVVEASVPKEFGRLRLSDAKRDAAGIATSTVEPRKLQPVSWAPATFGYDETRHLEIKASADGVIRALSVRTGDTVAAGQVVALVDAPEIGERRADVLLREAEWVLADRERQQARQIQENVRKLLERLKPSPPIAELQREFAAAPLGEFRETIFTAVSKLRMADELVAKLRPLADQGISSGRSVIEQQHAQEIAGAAYRGACEQAEFQANQRRLKCDSAADDAARRLAIAKERLISLTGTGMPATDAEPDGAALSLWSVRAPIAGTVEELSKAVGERLTIGEGFMVVAETRQLWVHAEVRDREWHDLHLEPGQVLEVQSPAIPDRTWSAEVVFTGRSQSTQTRAIPITVRIDNADGRLRPGMFARVALPAGEPRTAVAVPASAIQHDGPATFVFVEAGGEFVRSDVRTGLTDDRFVEVVSGVEAGQRVVSSGAFYLKSELLLEPDE
jgi:cobalt-zinc-cadmium efflux system membrane fusion protein